MGIHWQNTCPLPSAGEDSDGSTPLDYSDDNEAGSVKASDDNVEKVIEDDNDNATVEEQGDKVIEDNNATVDEQGDKTEALEEMIVGNKKPVLTQEGIMQLIENQATSN